MTPDIAAKQLLEPISSRVPRRCEGAKGESCVGAEIAVLSRAIAQR